VLFFIDQEKVNSKLKMLKFHVHNYVHKLALKVENLFIRPYLGVDELTSNPHSI